MKDLHHIFGWAQELQQKYKDQLAGLAICVRDPNGTVIYNGSWGEQDKFGRHLANDAIFNIFSQGKVFTAVAIHQLVEEGRLGLDDRLTERLPELKGKNPKLDEISLRQALSHQTTFNAEGGSRSEAGFHDEELWIDGKKPFPESEVMESFAVPDDLFSDEMGYSNRVYALLGRIIERASGMPYADYVKRNIIQKHELGEIYPRLMDIPASERNRIAVGYFDDAVSPINVENQGAWTPAGNFFATSEAMSKFWGKLSSGQILSPAARDEMFTPVALAGSKARPNLQYGLGVFVENSQNETSARIGHAGNNHGYQSETVIDQGYIISVMQARNDRGDLPDEQRLANFRAFGTAGIIDRVMESIRQAFPDASPLRSNKSLQRKLNRAAPRK